MSNRPLVAAERLREVLSYDPESGRFEWKRNTSRKKLAGRSAGGLQVCSGYQRLSVDGRRYFAHRLAWLYVNGVWPSGQIDHVNGHRSDNRISNLRDVTHAVNTQNQRAPRSTNRSGYLGTAFFEGRWSAYIGIDGKSKYLGRYLTPEAAHAAYVEAKRQLHPGCTI
jgi:hypothetical protein